MSTRNSALPVATVGQRRFEPLARWSRRATRSKPSPANEREQECQRARQRSLHSEGRSAVSNRPARCRCQTGTRRDAGQSAPSSTKPRERDPRTKRCHEKTPYTTPRRNHIMGTPFKTLWCGKATSRTDLRDAIVGSKTIGGRIVASPARFESGGRISTVKHSKVQALVARFNVKLFRAPLRLPTSIQSSSVGSGRRRASRAQGSAQERRRERPMQQPWGHSTTRAPGLFERVEIAERNVGTTIAATAMTARHATVSFTAVEKCSPSRENPGTQRHPRADTALRAPQWPTTFAR